MIFKGFISYNKLTKQIKKYKNSLMPYQKKVSVLIKNTQVESYFSPLKCLITWLLKIIIASDLKAYKHILKNKINSVLIILIKLIYG